VTDPSAGRPERPPRPCPICKRMSLPAFHPFCSKRCADIDLSRWFSGVYAAPAEDDPDAADRDAPPPPSRDDGTG
jgi:endogenous inhibitor of DNA gyrase (YacG/DUF329 family)